MSSKSVRSKILTRDTIQNRLAVAKQILQEVDQAHVLRFVNQMDESGRNSLLQQIEGLDWSLIARLIQSHVRRSPAKALPQDLQPAPWFPYQPSEKLKPHYAKATAIGESLIMAGKVAAFTVAGGQGSRLGWDGPKGTFPATPIRRASLFACFADYLHKIEEKFGSAVPWYIMTSATNDGATRKFFEDQNFFGLNPSNVMLFPQAMLPAIDRHSGKVLLQAPDQIALSPNGHGGSLAALYNSGAIEDMKQRGVEQISYTQVDNPLVRVVDPVFIGLHAAEDAQMSSKMLPKRHVHEKVGVFGQANGKIMVIEYTDFPPTLAEERLPDGTLRFGCGSIAIHMIRVDFIEAINTSQDGFALPFHRAEKKVPYIDLETGRRFEPTEPNAVKLETFVFDALPLCSGTPGSVVYETCRTEEFAPIKNGDSLSGEPVEDSPISSSLIQTHRAARWLKANGVQVPYYPDGSVQAVIEISQRTAIEAADLSNIKLPEKIEPRTSLLL